MNPSNHLNQNQNQNHHNTLNMNNPYNPSSSTSLSSITNQRNPSLPPSSSSSSAIDSSRPHERNPSISDTSPNSGNINMPVSRSRRSSSQASSILGGAEASPASAAAIAEILAVRPTPIEQPPSSNWPDIPVSEVIKTQTLHWVLSTTPALQAITKLVEEDLAFLVIRESNTSLKVRGIFDYSDIIGFLMCIVEQIGVNTNNPIDIIEAARKRADKTVADIADFGQKDELQFFKESTPIGDLVPIMGAGFHRIAITQDNGDDVIGILTQAHLVEYLWNNSRCFMSIDNLLQSTLKELQIGNTKVISISSDKQVYEAFDLMRKSGISSLAVVDQHYGLLGNISAIDVRLVIRTSYSHLLMSSCLHYLSIIKLEQGLFDGKDSTPHFHVGLSSTLAFTVAKLIATKTHRLWIVGPCPITAASSGIDLSNSSISATAGSAGSVKGDVSGANIANVPQALYPPCSPPASSSAAFGGLLLGSHSNNNTNNNLNANNNNNKHIPGNLTSLHDDATRPGPNNNNNNNMRVASTPNSSSGVQSVPSSPASSFRSMFSSAIPQHLQSPSISSMPSTQSVPSSGSANGYLQGVVSVTDILNAFSKTIGQFRDPREAREERRRRTSSVSTSELAIFEKSFKQSN